MLFSCNPLMTRPSDFPRDTTAVGHPCHASQPCLAPALLQAGGGGHGVAQGTIFRGEQWDKLFSGLLGTSCPFPPGCPSPGEPTASHQAPTAASNHTGPVSLLFPQGKRKLYEPEVISRGCNRNFHKWQEGNSLYPEGCNMSQLRSMSQLP